MTGTLQTFARKYQQPINTLSFDFTVRWCWSTAALMSQCGELIVERVLADVWRRPIDNFSTRRWRAGVWFVSRRRSVGRGECAARGLSTWRNLHGNAIHKQNAISLHDAALMSVCRCLIAVSTYHPLSTDRGSPGH